jgi:hypothetical protein
VRRPPIPGPPVWSRVIPSRAPRASWMCGSSRFWTAAPRAHRVRPPEKIKRRGAQRRSCGGIFTDAEAWAGRRRGRMWTPHAVWCVLGHGVSRGWGRRDLYGSPGRPNGRMEYSAARWLQIRIVSLRFLGFCFRRRGSNSGFWSGETAMGSVASLARGFARVGVLVYGLHISLCYEAGAREFSADFSFHAPAQRYIKCYAQMTMILVCDESISSETL